MFSSEESQALQNFLNRVNLTGQEAQTMVYLQNRVQEMTQEEEQTSTES